MEGDDEEFEKLLGEIPQAMEGNTQLDDPESAEKGACMVRSNSIESLNGIFKAFRPNSEFECRDEECARAYSMHTALSDGIIKTESSMVLHPSSKVVQEQTIGFVHKEAVADPSLATVFANLKVEMGSPMQSNFSSHHHKVVSLDTPRNVSSRWVGDMGSLESSRKQLRPDTHAILDGHLLGADKNGTYVDAYNRRVGLEHRGSLLSQYSGDQSFNTAKAMGLESGIDRVHQGFGVQVTPNHSFKYQVPMPCSAQAEAVPSIFLDGLDGWQHNSKVVSYLQAKELHKLKLLQQERERDTIDEVLANYPQDTVNFEHYKGLSPITAGRDHVYGHLGIEATFSPLSCGYPLRQRPVNPHVDRFCTCCTQYVCSTGNDCSALQGKFGCAALNKDFQASSALLSNGLMKAPTCCALCDEKPQVKILSRKSLRVAAPASSPLVGWCHNKSSNAGTYRQKGRCYQCSTALPDESPGQENCTKSAWGLHAMQQGPLYNSLADIEGRILAVAKDQHGCRFLQRKFDEGSCKDVEKIFAEVVDHAVDLMVDPFGNYLIQKLLEVCTDDQRSDLIQSVTNKAELVNVSLNMHGTRAVQKLIETLKSPQHVAIVTASLRSGAVTLIKDLNGNHVIQRCLQHLSNQDNEFIFEAAAHNCVEIATHRHGCCVLQRCIDHSTGVARQNLIWEIALNSLRLAQDSFGNYVVQYVLELGLPWAIKEVIHRLVENYARLSLQKFSSNVVEKCLKFSEEGSRARIVQELIDSSQLLQLLQDPYANYVIQSALMVSKGALRASLVEAIRPHVPSLRNSPYGKRILSRSSLKKF